MRIHPLVLNLSNAGEHKFYDTIHFHVPPTDISHTLTTIGKKRGKKSIRSLCRCHLAPGVIVAGRFTKLCLDLRLLQT